MPDRTDREIIEAATPGPWTCTPCSGSIYYPQMLLHLGPDGTAFPPPLSWQIRANDAAFISASRTRWPAALDKLERLERAIEEHRHAHADGIAAIGEDSDYALWRVLDEVKK